MNKPPTDSASLEGPTGGSDLGPLHLQTESEAEAATDSQRLETRNFLALALYQILLRTGWIFKTESIIMPAVLDSLSGAGWVRGWLPVLNRFGYSIPPLLMARRIKVMQRKKWSLFSTTVYMSLVFFGMAGMFLLDRQAFGFLLPTLFLILYSAFFISIGVNQLSFNTLQGKLVPVRQRGRLLLVSNTVGAVTAIGSAMWLMPRWLAHDPPQFEMVFGFSGVLFAVSSLATLSTVERPDFFTEAPSAVHHYFMDAIRTLRRDATFRRLCFVGAMYGTSIMLFPHYQNLGLQGLHLELGNLMWWVVVQNVGTGLFSIPAGPIADRFGNRLVLRIGILCIIAAPLLAVAVLYFPTHAKWLFNLVFFFVGVTPVVLKTFQNFALELSEPEEHPRYLSTISLVIAAPIVFSPVAGWLVDQVGHAIVFSAIVVALVLGWLATFGLREPRGE